MLTSFFYLFNDDSFEYTGYARAYVNNTVALRDLVRVSKEVALAHLQAP